MLTDKEFQALLTRACRVASEHRKLSQEINAAFEARYGTTYNEVGADKLIDGLDYGTVARISVADCDEEMNEAGYAPRKEGY